VAYRFPSLVAACAAILAFPAAAQSLSVPYVMDTLPNGLRLIVHEDHSVPIVAVNLRFLVGSSDERPGRTGFAHLYEHLMFMGSEHAIYPAFDRMLEAAGADNNGATWEYGTMYTEDGPATALPLMMWLDSDRMGWFLPTMDSAKVDLQRDVVKNERRQSVENQPYGLASETVLRLLYPPSNPYSWPVIGSMADLSAASLADVKEFFRIYYAPNNAVLVVAGDVQADSVRRAVRYWFGEIPRGPAITRPNPAAVTLARDTSAVLEDKVQLARVYDVWPTVRAFSPDEPSLELTAYLLTGAKNSRLTKPMVYQDEIASEVYAWQNAKPLAGDFYIVATARPDTSLTVLQGAIQAQLARLAADGPTARELAQAKNAIEAAFLERLEGLSGFGGKAASLNSYYYLTGDPDYFAQDLARYQAVSAADIQRVVRTYLLKPKVVVSVVPEGRRALAATAAGATP